MSLSTATQAPGPIASSRYTYRRLAIGELPAVNDLYNLCHRAQRPLEEAHWLYRDNPNGHAMIVAAFGDNGELVGVRPALPWKFLWRGTERSACEFADAMVAPQHRNRGIFTRLVKQMCAVAEQEGHTLFTIPNGNSLPVYQRLPMLRVFGACETRVKPISWPRYIGYRLGLEGHEPESGHANGGQRLREGDTVLAPIDRFECDVEQLHAEVGQVTAGFTHRTRDFLQWRYFGSPLRRYRVALIEQRGHVRGYVAVRMIHRVAHLIDVFMKPDPALACRAFGLLMEWATRMGAIAIHFNASRGNFFHGIAAQCGFWLKKTSGSLVLDRKSAELFAPQRGGAIGTADTYFVMGDFDFF